MAPLRFAGVADNPGGGRGKATWILEAFRAAGVDLRPELRAIAAASRPREKTPPHAIADMAERVARHFDQPDAEPRLP
jgi:hypothetical protein